MISVRYKGQPVDIQPNQRIELTRNNPMFLVDNIFGEFSTPFVITYSERNVSLFGYFFFDLSTKKKEKFEVEIYDNGSFSFNATLVIETSHVDRRVIGRGNAAGYLLTGISNFLSNVKDVKANTLKLGGPRTIPYTTSDPIDASNGYVQHFHNTRDNNDDYITAPIRNDLWTGDEDDDSNTGWMNSLDVNANLAAGQAYVLQPRLKYVLETLFRENGWILDTSAMAGTGWEKIFMFSVKPLFTTDVTWTEHLTGDTYENIPTVTFKSDITFNLAEWISSEVTCSQLLLEHCKKYGWVPLCNNDSNVCRLVPLRNARAGRVVDWTKYAGTQVDADFSADPKVFEFKNTLPSNDELPSTPSFENLTQGTPVLNKAALPDPLGNYDNVVIYSYAENQWFNIDLDETTNQRQWVVFADNIYDQAVDGANMTFETAVSTLPVYRTLYRTSGEDYYGLFPYCKQSRNKEWGMRTLVYHGMVQEVKADGTAGSKQYPYLSSIRVLPNGSEDMDWSNVLSHIKEGEEDFGIIPYWFQPWLDLIGINEIDDQKLFVPIHELYNYRWDDIINIFNIPYLVQSFIEPRGYTGFIQAKLQKLTLDKFDAEGAGVPPVYLKMVFENSTFTPLIVAPGDPTLGITYTDVTEGDWNIYVFEDAAGTIPSVPSAPLSVNIENRTQNDSNPLPDIRSGPYTMNILGQLTVLGVPYVLHDMSDAVLNIPPNPPSHFTRSFKILPGSGYRIIP